MRLSVLKLLVCFSLASVGAFADIVDYSWNTAAQTPSGFNPFQGTTCSPPSNCVPGAIDSNGDPYVIESVTLDNTSTNGINSNWTLTVQEEAPITFDGYGPTAFGDFLFEDPSSFGTYYGIVLGGTCTGADAFWNNPTTGTPDLVSCSNSAPGATYTGHDGLTAGQVYQSSDGIAGYQDGIGARSSDPVSVGTSMTAVTGATVDSFSVTRDSYTSASTPYALYTIVDNFTVPIGTISDSANLAASISSYVCGNYVVLGTPGSPVPEPRALFLFIPGLLWLGKRLTRRQTVQAN